MTSVLMLLIASLALLVGPGLHLLGKRSRAVHELVDGFTLVLIAGLCLLVLPHVVTEIGLVGLLPAAVGAMLPVLAHRFGGGPRWTLVALALVAHVLLDGAVLSIQDESDLIGWAVVAHRLPVGFAIVLAAQGLRHPNWSMWGVAFAMILATVGGFVAGPSLVASLPEASTAGLEALVAGVLLHVVFAPHRPAHTEAGHTCTSGHAQDSLSEDDFEHHNCKHDHHRHDHHHGHEPHHGHKPHHGHDHHHEHKPHHGHDHHHEHKPHHGHDHDHDLLHHHHGHHHGSGANDQRWATAGALLGAAAILSGTLFGDSAVESSVPTFIRTLGVLVLESGPALLLGYVLAGVVPFLLTPARTTALGQGGRLSQSLRGVAFGLPLPVCSCGVLPLYESLIRRGAPPTAALAFFVATPELGLDAVLLSVPLLGSSLTVARVVAAFAVAVLVALLVGRYSGASKETRNAEAAKEVSDEPLDARIRAGLRFGFVEVFDHTMPWIALGLIIAAAAEPMLSHGAIANIPSFLQVPLAALVGVPVYVCASGATPIAALAIHKGLSSGAAIAFLIAGPATNVTTFGVLARLHSRRIALLFGVTVTTLAILAGWTVDILGVPAANVLETHAYVETHGSGLAWLCVGGLVILTISSLVRQGPRGALQQILEPIHSH